MKVLYRHLSLLVSTAVATRCQSLKCLLVVVLLLKKLVQSWRFADIRWQPASTDEFQVTAITISSR